MLRIILILILLVLPVQAQRFVKSVNTIAAMKALNVNDIHTNVFVNGYSLPNDGGQGTFVWNSASTTTTNLGTVFTGWTNTVGRWLRQYSGPLNVQWFGATASGSQTAAIQNAITTATAAGSEVREVYVPKGITFAYNNLYFPDDLVFIYHGGSDTNDVAGPTLSSGEYIINPLGVNAAGVVNEMRVEAPFHPGFIVNVRKDVTNQVPVYGAGQNSTNPARASILFQDEGVDTLLAQTKNYPDTNGISGFLMALFFNHITLTNIGTASFVSVPAVGEVLRGTTSGAKGFVVSVSAASMLVTWITGIFQTGETVVDSNETSSTAITGTLITAKYSDGWYLDRDRNGYTGFGTPKPSYPFTFAGAVGMQGTRNTGQYIPVTNAQPVIVFSDTFELPTSTGALQYTAHVTTPLYTLTNANFVIGATNALTNPQSWNKVAQIYSSGNGAAFSVKDQNQQFDFASYLGQLRITRANATAALIVASDDAVGIKTNLFLGSVTGPGIYFFTGTPEGNLAAPAGSICLNVSGGAGSSFYAKTNGAGNTGWSAR